MIYQDQDLPEIENFTKDKPCGLCSSNYEYHGPKLGADFFPLTIELNWDDETGLTRLEWTCYLDNDCELFFDHFVSENVHFNEIANEIKSALNYRNEILKKHSPHYKIYQP